MAVNTDGNEPKERKDSLGLGFMDYTKDILPDAEKSTPKTDVWPLGKQALVWGVGSIFGYLAVWLFFAVLGDYGVLDKSSALGVVSAGYGVLVLFATKSIFRSHRESRVSAGRKILYWVLLAPALLLGSLFLVELLMKI